MRLHPFPPLYPILDFGCVFAGEAPDLRSRRERLCGLVTALAEAGVQILQYRNKVDEDSLVLEDAMAMRAAAPEMTLLLNDRAALVGQAGWDGVHVGQSDLAPAEARALAGSKGILGLSTHNEEQVGLADLEPVDYIAIGPVFATSSKADTSPVIGVEGVARARQLTHKPLVAIGGITLANARSVFDAGADSVAVISAIFGAACSPAEAARQFLRIR
ncbi:MAG TPA: thiamine phosphate synthase [Acidobacteriaceae bacterium]|jgi:thiamine-phosphate pyrophosphorylase|nr:thiamine phosphate synthase [Acidobacteriaceae bacterium]